MTNFSLHFSKIYKELDELNKRSNLIKGKKVIIHEIKKKKENVSTDNFMKFQWPWIL
tara:strand:+ start:111 stop:281 length:171 start_codon:yes stop_codon:yes gene_type:complete